VGLGPWAENRGAVESGSTITAGAKSFHRRNNFAAIPFSQANNFVRPPARPF